MPKKRRRKKGNRPGPPPPPSVPQTGPGGGTPDTPSSPPDTAPSKKERREQALERRRARERRRRFRYIGIGALVLVVLLGLWAFQGFQSSQDVAEYVTFSQDAAGCTDVEETGGLSRDHVEQAVEYETSPPAGGAHSASTARAGVYQEPFAENPQASSPTIYQAMHSLEHGYVIVWHDPELSGDARQALERTVRGESKTILVPYGDLEQGDAVALTAWGRLQRCSEADAEVVERFADIFRERTGPEPDAP